MVLQPIQQSHEIQMAHGDETLPEMNDDENMMADGVEEIPEEEHNTVGPAVLGGLFSLVVWILAMPALTTLFRRLPEPLLFGICLPITLLMIGISLDNMLRRKQRGIAQGVLLVIGGVILIEIIRIRLY